MKMVQLGEIASFSQGQQVSIPDQKTEQFENSDTFLRIVNYTQNSQDFRYIPKQNQKYHVNADDIIMVRYGAVGFVGRGLEGVLANNMFKVNYDKNLVNGDFLYRALWSNSVQRQLLHASQSTSMSAINFKTVSRVKLPLPPIDQQKQIANILDTADAYRQKTKALIAKYDALTQSLFLDMFGDPVTNPNGWESKKLGLVSSMKAGKFIKASEIHPQQSTDLYSCYGGNGLRGFVKSFTHEGEFILIGRQGALCGNVKMVNGKFHATEHAIVCTPIMEYKTLWLYHMLDMINLNKYATGAAQPGLNVGTLAELEIMFTPYDLQIQFAERVKAIEVQKAIAQQELNKADELFNSLLQKAFKGELI